MVLPHKLNISEYATGLSFVWQRLPHKRLYVTFRIVMCCATAWLPLLSGTMVNLVTAPGFSVWVLCLYACGTVFIEMANYTIGTWLGYFWNKQTRWATAELHKTLWRRAQQLSAQRWEQMSPGMWSSRIERDIGVVFGFLQSLLDFTIRTGVSFCFASVIILCKVPILWFVLVGFAVVQVFTYRHWSGRFRHMAKRMRTLDYVMGEVNYDLISMTGLFKNFGVAHFFFPVYDRMQDRLVRRSLGEARLHIHYNTIMQLETWAVRLFTLGFCLWLYSQGKLTLGDIVVYNMYVGQLIGIVIGITGFLPSLEQGRESATALTELLQWCAEDASQRIVRTDGNRIQARHAFFRYEKRPQDVIKDLTMDIMPNSYICFVGRNGSGKSTLIKLLMGVYAPTSGQISALSSCAFVPQHNIIFNDTLLENVRLRNPAISSQEVVKVLKQCGLTTFLAHHPLEEKLRAGALSGGEMQLLAIARAMVRHPKVLLLDELTNNLDIVARETIQAVLDSIRTQCTIISVTHDLRATRSADRIFLFQSARIEEVGGAPEERERRAAELLRKAYNP